MSDFGSVDAAAIEATCQTGAAEAAEGLQRAFDQAFEIEVGSPGPIDRESLAAELAGPGLAVVLTVEDSGALLLLSESSGLLPEWYAQPDATGESKLATLAQELGMVLLPEQHMPSEFLAARVDSLSAAMDRAQLEADSQELSLSLTAGEQTGALRMIWPIASPDAVIESKQADQSSTSTSENPQPEQSTPPNGVSHRLPVGDAGAEGFARLPAYSRSLLKIKVPVVVTLASTKQPLSRILELGPGSIIQFDKSCDETLDLEVGEQVVAEGEAVKVGEKFGLRVTSITMPKERFWVVRGKRQED